MDNLETWAKVVLTNAGIPLKFNIASLTQDQMVTIEMIVLMRTLINQGKVRPEVNEKGKVVFHVIGDPKNDY